MTRASVVPDLSKAMFFEHFRNSDVEFDLNLNSKSIKISAVPSFREKSELKTCSIYQIFLSQTLVARCREFATAPPTHAHIFPVVSSTSSLYLPFCTATHHLDLIVVVVALFLDREFDLYVYFCLVQFSIFTSHI